MQRTGLENEVRDIGELFFSQAQFVVGWHDMAGLISLVLYSPLGSLKLGTKAGASLEPAEP